MSPVFDQEALLERVDHDWEFLVEIVQILCSDGRRLMEEIRSAAASADASAVSRSAHTLKGMTSNFCAAEALDAARLVESIGRSGDLTTAPAAVVALEVQLDRLIEALNAFLATRRPCAS